MTSPLPTIARLVFLAALVFIVGNAVTDAIADEEFAWAVAEAVAFPITFLLHPFLAGSGAPAWPFSDDVALPVALLVAAVAYAYLVRRDVLIHR